MFAVLVLVLTCAVGASEAAVSLEACSVGGKLYEKGQTFITKCSSCTCDGGTISCRHICAEAGLRCKKDERPDKMKMRSAPECFCKVPVCVKKDQCLLEDKLYTQGQRFITKCNSCTCQGSSGIHCVPVCTATSVQCKAGQKKDTILRKRAPECTCKEPICVNNNQCAVEGKVYQQGQRFIKGCSSCSCRAQGIVCVHMCPSFGLLCKKDQVLGSIVRHRTPTCSCRHEPICLNKDQCTFEDKVYTKGQHFAVKCSSCTCAGSGKLNCMPLCTPRLVLCRNDQETAYIQKQRGPECTCKEPICVNKKLCFFEGSFYRKGQSFISKSCRSCKCDGLNNVGCVSLCPQLGVQCKVGETKTYTMKYRAPGCNCKIPKCMKQTSQVVKAGVGAWENECNRLNADGNTCKLSQWICRAGSQKQTMDITYKNGRRASRWRTRSPCRT